MKKTIFKTLLIGLMTLSIFSCSKDDSPSSTSFQEENFFDGYLSTTGFNQEFVEFVNSGNFEFGLEFAPLVNGSITSLRLKLPDANPSLRVTIWDKVAGTIIKTEIVNVATANTVYNFDIIDIPLVKDKEYAITMNSNDWYNRKKTDGTDATYPLTVGNIKIVNYIWSGGITQNYPGSESGSYVAGDLSFNFIQKQ